MENDCCDVEVEFGPVAPQLKAEIFALTDPDAEAKTKLGEAILAAGPAEIRNGSKSGSISATFPGHLYGAKTLDIEDLRERLMADSIPFTVWSDGVYPEQASMAYWRPGMPEPASQFINLEERYILIPAQKVLAALEGLPEALEIVKTTFGLDELDLSSEVSL